MGIGVKKAVDEDLLQHEVGPGFGHLSTINLIMPKGFEVERVQAADSTELERWSVQILQSDTMETVFSR